MMLRKTLLSALLLGAFAVPALAEEGQKGPEGHDGPKMEHKNPADTDGDGFLSRAEFDAAQAKRFAEMDKDGDGKIRKEENKAFREAKRAEFKEKRKEWQEKRSEKSGEHGGEAPEQPPVE